MNEIGEAQVYRTKTAQPHRTEARKKFFHQLFTTALEGGIGYWSEAHEYHWFKPDTEGIHDSTADDLDNFYAIIRPNEDEWGVADTVYQPPAGVAGGQVFITALRIDIDVMERGWNLFMDKVIEAAKSEKLSTPCSIKYFREAVIQYLTDMEEGDSDAVVADIVVQYGLFGEVIYS